MESTPIQVIAEEVTTNSLVAAKRLAVSVRSVMEIRDLLEAGKAHGMAQITLLGEAAQLQIQDWERTDIPSLIPYYPMQVQPVCQNPATNLGCRASRVREENKQWTRSDVCKYTGLSESTIKRMHEDGEIPLNVYRQRKKGGKIVYFPRPFMAWFEQHPKNTGDNHGSAQKSGKRRG